MQGTEHGLLIPRITESRRSVRDGMRFQELSSASSALNFHSKCHRYSTVI